jgi:plasmid stabilization system protein ParE
VVRVEVPERAFADLERCVDFIVPGNPQLAREQLTSARRALELLADHRMLSSPAEDRRREPALSRARYGCVAKLRSA